MFLVINKEKLLAYIVSIVTVVMLFVMAGIITPKGNTVETSANIQKQDVTNNNESKEKNKVNEE